MILSLFPASWTTPTHATTTPAPVFAPARHGRILCTAGTAAASPLAAGAAPVVAAYWDEVCVAQQASSSRRAVLQPTAVDDADLVLEYLTSCGQLCAEEGCEVVAAFVDGAPSAAGDGAERAISLQIDRCDAGGPTLVEGVVAPTDAVAVAGSEAMHILNISVTEMPSAFALMSIIASSMPAIAFAAIPLGLCRDPRIMSQNRIS